MNTTNNKQIATAISDAEAELTLAQIIANTCDSNKQPHAYKLQQTYNQFIYALADSAQSAGHKPCKFWPRLA